MYENQEKKLTQRNFRSSSLRVSPIDPCNREPHPDRRPDVNRSLIILLLSLLIATSIQADWSHDAYENDLVCAVGATIRGTATCPDGEGGFYVAWLDSRGGAPTTIRPLHAALRRRASGSGIATAC